MEQNHKETATKLGRSSIPTPRKHTSKTNPGWILKENQTPSWATKTNVDGANLKRNRHKNSYTDNGQNRMMTTTTTPQSTFVTNKRSQVIVCKTKADVQESSHSSLYNKKNGLVKIRILIFHKLWSLGLFTPSNSTLASICLGQRIRRHPT